MTDAQVDDHAGEDEHNGVVHDRGGPDGAHGHDLGGPLPVDGIVEAVTQPVEEAAALHLLEVYRGEHETEEEEERLEDDDLGGVEDRALPGEEEDVPDHDHGQAAPERDARPADGEEPVGEHEEDPEREVDEGDGDLAEDGELVRHVHVDVLAEVAVAAAGVLHDPALGLAEVATAVHVGDAALDVGGVVPLHVEHRARALHTQFAAADLLGREGGHARSRRAEEGGVHGERPGDGGERRSPLSQERRLGRRFLSRVGGLGRRCHRSDAFDVVGVEGTAHGVLFNTWFSYSRFWLLLLDIDGSSLTLCGDWSSAKR